MRYHRQDENGAMTSPENEVHTVSASEREKRITEAAERALNEAAERRKIEEQRSKSHPVEKGGQDGPDPARYGDWEKDGIISDF